MADLVIVPVIVDKLNTATHWRIRGRVMEVTSFPVVARASVVAAAGASSASASV